MALNTGLCFLGLFMVNIFISIVVTVYIVVYPAEWIVELMEVSCVSVISCLSLNALTLRGRYFY